MKSLRLTALGIAAFAVAAVPAMTFAAGNNVTSGSNDYKDELSVTIDQTCTFARKTGDGAHTNGTNYTLKNVTNGTVVSNVGTWSGDKLSGTLSGNSKQENFGKSQFNVICNNANGWKVTATPTDLTKSGETRKIAHTGVNTPYASSFDGKDNWGFTTAITTKSPERAKVANASNTAGSDVITSWNGNATAQTTGNDGEDFTVTYWVTTSSDLPTGTYEGSVTYTFAQLNSPEQPAPKNQAPAEEKNPDEEKTVESEEEPEETPVEKKVEESKGTGEPLLTIVQPVNNYYSNYSNDGAQQVASGQDSNTSGKTDALGVVSSTGMNGARTIATAVPDPEDNHSGLIVAMCAAGVAATAAAGAYLYNKNKEEQ